MSTASVRAKDRRGLRLEFLEDRNLLSGAAAKIVAADILNSAPAAGSPTTTAIHGQFVEQYAKSGLYISTQPGYISFNGHGNAAPYGNAFFSAQQINATNTADTTLTITKGNGLLTTFRGYKLFVSYTGTGTVSGHKVVPVSLTGTITSGTGPFLNETGTFAATGTLNPVTGRLVVNYSIALKNPAFI